MAYQFGNESIWTFGDEDFTPVTIIPVDSLQSVTQIENVTLVTSGSVQVDSIQSLTEVQNVSLSETAIIQAQDMSSSTELEAITLTQSGSIYFSDRIVVF